MLSPGLDATGDGRDAAGAVAWCEILNDHLAADIIGDGRHSAIAALPIVDGSRAAQELRRCVEDLGMVGGMIGTQVSGNSLSAAGLEPLFEAAESLDAVLLVHPVTAINDPRFEPRHFRNICAYPLETAMAALSLYFDGIFDRWPRLQVLLAHGGGALPTIAGRAARASAVGLTGSHPTSASAILNSFLYDSVVHDPNALGSLINQVGPERVAVGTDSPMAMRVENPVALLEEAVDRTRLDPDVMLKVRTMGGRFLHADPG